MRTVELVTGIRSSALGFGCAPILGSVDAKRARRALDCAFDCGITHYDLARSYGYGEAEEFVGKVMQGKRNQLTIATKFGIQANWKASLLRPLKPIVRRIQEARKKENQPAKSTNTAVVATAADRFHDRIPFRSVDMRKSLEKSLRALATDYVDYLFVHEPKESLIYIDELADTVELLKKEGKIRAWGLAYLKSQESLHDMYLDRFDLLQFDTSFGTAGYKATVAERGTKPNVLFSPFRGGANNMKPKEKLQKLFNDFPNSVVLCSMFSEQHIQDNASLVNN